MPGGWRRCRPSLPERGEPPCAREFDFHAPSEPVAGRWKQLPPLDDLKDVGEVVGPQCLVWAGREGVPLRIVWESTKVFPAPCQHDPVGGRLPGTCLVWTHSLVELSERDKLAVVRQISHGRLQVKAVVRDVEGKEAGPIKFSQVKTKCFPSEEVARDRVRAECVENDQ